MENTLVDTVATPTISSQLGLVRGMEIDRRFWASFFTLQDLTWLANPFFLYFFWQYEQAIRSGSVELGCNWGAFAPALPPEEREFTPGELTESGLGVTKLGQAEGRELTPELAESGVGLPTLEQAGARGSTPVWDEAD